MRTLKNMTRTSITLLILLGMLLGGYSQSTFENHASAGLGYSVIAEELPEGFLYKPLTILPSATIWGKGHFTVYAEGQFTQAISLFGFKAEYEAGANFGLRYHLFVGRQLRINAAIASGPHYITIETSRQANGFIFSDNFELGLSYYLRSVDTEIQARWRYRHISNAGLQSPNGGIDNLFLVIGVAKKW